MAIDRPDRTDRAGDQGAVDLLYVADDADNLELTLQALKKHGIVTRMHHARDGAAAMEFLAGTGVAVNAETGLRLILIDLERPGVSGPDVLRRVRADERTRTVPVAILSSSSERTALEEAYALGVNSYVVKPADADACMDVVGRTCRYWMVLNEPVRG